MGVTGVESGQTTITWVNHASFVVRRGSTALLVDPWLVGTAFDDGWEPYSPTAFGPEQRDEVTHIWFSHEHPDHFSPGSLKSIPAARRPEIEVLYQRTRDRKVLDFCGGLGFRTREVPDHTWTRLGPDLEVWVEPWSSGDSILAVRTPDSVILNVNDAVIDQPSSVASLRRRLAGQPIDVLMTQFSYANWEGNPEDVDRRRAAAAAKLDAMVEQVRGFAPRQVVPFASFVHFCHEENAYLNDSVNSVTDAVDAVRARTSASPVVLYPGDTWVVGEACDPQPAQDAYDADLERARATTERRISPTVPLAELTDLAQGFASRLDEDNGQIVVGALRRARILRPATLWITDLDLAVRFDLDGLEEVGADPDRCDLALGSEALAFCFRHRYGGATLNVNGRFREPSGGDPSAFRRYLQLSNLNNQGISALGGAPEVVRKVSRQARRRVPTGRPGGGGAA